MIGKFVPRGFDSIIEFLKRSKNIEVIIVDEAHRFRNGTTETYEKAEDYLPRTQGYIAYGNSF